jgi:hypothetical protein
VHCVFREVIVVELDKLREGSDFPAKLLAAGMRDGPSSSARRAVGAALGLSFAAGTSATAASAAALGTGTAPPATIGAGLVAKWCALGFLAGTAVSAAVAVPAAQLRASRSPSAPSASAAIDAAARPPARSTELRADSVDEVPPVAIATPAERASLTPSARLGTPTFDVASPSPAAEVQAETTPSLSREVALLERVRERLRAGDTGGALVELDRVEPNITSLAMEAKLLRIEALLASGERPRAQELAAELERRYPNGPLGFRLRRLMGAP